MKKYDYIVWDFNGTIIDDVRIGIESINVLLSKRKLPTIKSKDEYQKSFCFPIIEWYRGLGFDFDAEDYTDIANEWVAEYISRESRAPLCEGVIELLDEFKKRNIKQIIISASEEKMLKRQLSAFGIEKYFAEVVGKNDIYASGKTEIAKRWRANNPGNILFIGDTDHDLDVASAIRADCILTSSGHQSYERLRNLKAEEGMGFDVVNCLRDILEDRV